MASISFIVLLAAATTILPSTVAAEPKVLGFDFYQERAAHNSFGLQRRQGFLESTIANNYAVRYLINVTIGTPPQPVSVILDTGSSDLWIVSADGSLCQQMHQICSAYGAFTASTSSTVSLLAANALNESYVDGTRILGDYISDVVHIGNTAVQNTTMGLASQGRRGNKPKLPIGIMGVGYAANEALAESSGQGYPNIVNELKSQGYISSLTYSLWLNDLTANTGRILFGGIDTGKMNGRLGILPIQPNDQTGIFDTFTVALSSISITGAGGSTEYSQNSLDLPVILDSGTSLTYLPDDIATAIINGVEGTDLGQDIGLAAVPCSLGQKTGTFSFGFGGPGGPTINVGLNELVIPAPLGLDGKPLTYNNGQPLCIFGIYLAGQKPLLLGDTFLRSAYVVYDLDNNQIGLANTNFKPLSSNIVEISGTIPGAAATASAFSAKQTVSTYALPTAPVTLSGGVQPAVIATGGTFNFGTPTATPTATPRSNSKSVASELSASPMKTALVVVGLMTVVSFVFGGAMVFL